MANKLRDSIRLIMKLSAALEERIPEDNRSSDNRHYQLLEESYNFVTQLFLEEEKK